MAKKEYTCFWGSVYDTPLQLLNQAREAVTLFKQVNQGDEGLARGRGSEGQCWNKPPPCFMKINWDASLDWTNKKMGMGAVVRDSLGEVVAAFSSIIPFIQDPDVAEAIAAWKAATFCCERGFQRMIFECDSMNVVAALRKGDECWNMFGQLIEDTKIMINSLQASEVKHTRRDANTAAHLLAKLALMQSIDQVWLEECPSSIQSIVLAEQDSSI